MAGFDVIRKMDGSHEQIGVYRITNVVNGKSYVGSTSATFFKRWKRHLNDLRGGRHHSQFLQRAFQKYTEGSFEFVILEVCDANECLAREQFWIDTLQTCDPKKGYNLLPIAGSRLGKKHSPDSIEKMRKAHRGKTQTPEHVEKRTQSRRGKSYPKISAAMRGRILSESHRESLRGKIFSPEHRARLSERAKEREAKRRRQRDAIGNVTPIVFEIPIENSEEGTINANV